MLTANNTYTQGTTVSGGVLALSGGDDRLWTTGNITVAAGGTLDLGNNIQHTSGIISFQGGVVQNGQLWNTDDTNPFFAQSGTITATLNSSNPNNTAGLVKTGNGTLFLASPWAGTNTATRTSTPAC